MATDTTYQVFITVFRAEGDTIAEEWQVDAESPGLNEALKKAADRVKKEVFKHGAG